MHGGVPGGWESSSPYSNSFQNIPECLSCARVCDMPNVSFLIPFILDVFHTDAALLIRYLPYDKFQEADTP